MKDFDLILDDCIDRLSRGETLEACLAIYPGHAEELRSSLMMASRVKDVSTFVPSDESRNLARQRFNTALSDATSKRGRSFISRLAYWPVAAAAMAAVLVFAVLGYNAAQPGASPFVPVSIPVTASGGNFVFLISDAVNAIDDFENLDVTIDKVGLLADSGWIEFVPEVRTIDLTLLPGDKNQAIWRGDMPEGHYSKVFIYVSVVTGVLKANGNIVDIKLPGNKIQIKSSFDVGTASVTGFVFDLTVTASGNPKNGLRYMLKAQIEESGASSIPAVVTP